MPAVRWPIWHYLVVVAVGGGSCFVGVLNLRTDLIRSDAFLPPLALSVVLSASWPP